VWLRPQNQNTPHRLGGRAKKSGRPFIKIEATGARE
jgi:hypothetical protein